MNKIGILLAFIPVVVGAIMAVNGGRAIWLAKESAGWPTTIGKIMRSEVALFRDNKGASYKPCLEYKYSVNGEVITGEKISFGDGFLAAGRNYAQRRIKNYSVGDEVTVYHSPDAVNLAVLEPGIHKTTFLLIYIGIGILSVGLWITLTPILRPLEPKFKVILCPSC